MFLTGERPIQAHAIDRVREHTSRRNPIRSLYWEPRAKRHGTQFTNCYAVSERKEDSSATVDIQPDEERADF